MGSLRSVLFVCAFLATFPAASRPLPLPLFQLFGVNSLPWPWKPIMESLLKTDDLDPSLSLNTTLHKSPPGTDSAFVYTESTSEPKNPYEGLASTGDYDTSPSPSGNPTLEFESTPASDGSSDVPTSEPEDYVSDLSIPMRNLKSASPDESTDSVNENLSYESTDIKLEPTYETTPIERMGNSTLETTITLTSYLEDYVSNLSTYESTDWKHDPVTLIEAIQIDSTYEITTFEPTVNELNFELETTVNILPNDPSTEETSHTTESVSEIPSTDNHDLESMDFITEPMTNSSNEDRFRSETESDLEQDTPIMIMKTTTKTDEPVSEFPTSTISSSEPTYDLESMELSTEEMTSDWSTSTSDNSFGSKTDSDMEQESPIMILKTTTKTVDPVSEFPTSTVSSGERTYDLETRELRTEEMTSDWSTSTSDDSFGSEMEQDTPIPMLKTTTKTDEPVSEFPTSAISSSEPTYDLESTELRTEEMTSDWSTSTSDDSFGSEMEQETPIPMLKTATKTNDTVSEFSTSTISSSKPIYDHETTEVSTEEGTPDLPASTRDDIFQSETESDLEEDTPIMTLKVVSKTDDPVSEFPTSTATPNYLNLEPKAVKLAATLQHVLSTSTSVPEPESTTAERYPDEKMPILFFTACMFLFLPVVNTISRFLQRRALKAFFGCFMEVMISMASLTLILIAFLKDSEGHRFLVTVLWSIPGLVWIVFTSLSIFMGLISFCRCAPFQTILKFSTYSADVALISACVLESQYKLFHEIKLLIGFQVSYWAFSIWMIFYILGNLFVLLDQWVLKEYGPRPRRLQTSANATEPAADPERQPCEDPEVVDEVSSSQSLIRSDKSDIVETHTFTGIEAGDQSAVTSMPSCILHIEDELGPKPSPSNSVFSDSSSVIAEAHSFIGAHAGEQPLLTSTPSCILQIEAEMGPSTTNSLIMSDKNEIIAETHSFSGAQTGDQPLLNSTSACILQIEEEEPSQTN